MTFLYMNDVHVGVVGPNNVAQSDALKMTIEEMIMKNIISNNKITLNQLGKYRRRSKKQVNHNWR